MAELVWIKDPELPLDQAREEWEQTRPSDENLITWAERIQDHPDSMPSTAELEDMARTWALSVNFLLELAGSEPPEGVHAGQPGGAFRGGEHPLPARAAPSRRAAREVRPGLPGRPRAIKGARRASRRTSPPSDSPAPWLKGTVSASADEQRVLARWSSWGAIPDVFDNAKDGWSAERRRAAQRCSPMRSGTPRRGRRSTRTTPTR